MPTVIGLFKRYEDADAAVRALEAQGVPQADLQFAARKLALQRRLEAGDAEPGTEGARGMGGLLPHAVTVSLVGLGPICTSPEIGHALAGKAGPGTALLGCGLSSTFLSWGFSREEAQDYAGCVSRGGILLLVRAEPELVPLARNVLRQHGAVRTGLTREAENGLLASDAALPTWAPVWRPGHDTQGQELVGAIGSGSNGWHPLGNG